MSEKLVSLAIFSNPVEAELVRGKLQNGGIPAVVVGDEAGLALLGMGSGVARVEVMVREDDLPRAEVILLEVEAELAQTDEPSEEIQEKPRKKRTSTDIRPIRESPIQPAAGPLPEEPIDEKAEDDLDADLQKPAEDELDIPEIIWTADAVAHRAFLAAIVGIFCGLATAYGLYLLVVQLPRSQGELSPKGSLKAYAAMGLVGLMGIPWLLAAAGLVGSLIASLLSR